LGIQTRRTIFFTTVQILCRWHWFNGMHNSWTQRSFPKSGEIHKKHGIGNKSREDGIHAQWKGHNIASGPCSRKLHI
jgi:hypothetical protein